MIPLKSRPLFTLTGRVGRPIDIGATPAGRRRIYVIESGEFDGERLRGSVLPGGADHMLVRPDGVVRPDVRLTLKTDHNQFICMSYGGMRHGPAEVMDRLACGEPVDASEYYFRILPTFETGSEKYYWINQIVTVGIGHRLSDGPIYYVYEIL